MNAVNMCLLSKNQKDLVSSQADTNENEPLSKFLFLKSIGNNGRSLMLLKKSSYEV